MAAGLIASPVEWQLLKGFLNCTQVDGWLSGGQWTENFERGGEGRRTERAGRTVTLTPRCTGKEMSLILKKKEVFKLKAVKKC